MLSTTSNTAVTTIPNTNNNIDVQQNNDKNNNLILVVGSSNQDLTTTSDILPALGETVMGKSFAIACGGKGANQAVAAASLKMGYTSTSNNPNANNMASVAMVTRVGDDLFGKNILDNFRRVGVNYFDEEETIVKDKNVQSGVANIAVETKSGDNQIIVTTRWCTLNGSINVLSISNVGLEIQNKKRRNNYLLYYEFNCECGTPRKPINANCLYR